MISGGSTSARDGAARGRKGTTSRIAACVQALLLLSLLAPAATQAEPPLALDELLQALRKPERSQARFVETRYLKILKRPLELTGTLVFAPPDRLERHTLTPREQSMVADGDRLTLEDKARGRVRTLALRDHPVLWAFIESFRATLTGDRSMLERFYEVQLAGSRARWQVSLTPRDAAMAAVVSRIRIAGSAGRVASVEIEEARGDRSVMTILEVAP